MFASTLVFSGAAVLLLASVVVAAPFEANTIHGGAVGPGSGADAGTYGTVQTKQRPISKVIALLKDMSTQLEAEQKEDTETFEELACWCETNTKEKTKAIADAQQKIGSLESSIEELSASSKKLKVDVSALDKAVEKGKKALAEAGEVRDKELAEFNKEDKDAVVAISGLHSAVQTLSKHNAGAALSQEALLQVRHVLTRHAGKAQLQKLGLLNRPRGEMSFLQQSTDLTSLTANSGEIFGMLTSMKESFETNMANARTQEEQSAAEYKTLVEAKTEEIAAAGDQSDSKSAQNAEAVEQLENDKTSIKDTTEQLEADELFLADVKKKCEGMEKEWQERQKMRQDEIKAVSGAMEILSDADARDLASKTTGFVQTASLSNRRATASRLLLAASSRLGRPQLSLLAVAMRSEVFDKMVAKIKELIAQLNKEKIVDQKEKDRCIAEQHDNDLATDEKMHQKTSLETKQADLNAQIQKLTDEMDAAAAEIAELQIEMKKAGETREKESEEFTTCIADQRAMQAVLKKALAKLREFYDSFAQTGEGEDEDDSQEPPATGEAGFKPYRKGGGGMVIATLDHIIKDSSRVQTDSMFANSNGQKAYEEFMKEMNKSLILLRRQIAEQTTEKGAAEADLTRVKADLMQNTDDLEAQDEINQVTHKDCDSFVHNYEKIQEARQQEVDALYEAMAMLDHPEEAAPPALL